VRPLRPGESAQLSWPGGAVECRVVAAAGAYVLLHPAHAVTVPASACSLTYLDGYVPMGFDGVVEGSAHPGELRFRVTDTGRVADRRSTVRLPLTEVPVEIGDHPAEILDVSAGGARVRCSRRLPRGTEVTVRAQLPGGPAIDADAIVRTSEPGIVCLEWTAMRDATAAEVGAWTVERLRHTVNATA
jgi:PilZ domain-containing protein